MECLCITCTLEQSHSTVAVDSPENQQDCYTGIGADGDMEDPAVQLSRVRTSRA